MGIRFDQAALADPCEFNTSFMPEMTKATTGVGLGMDRVPQLDLQSIGGGIDLPKLLLTPGVIKQDTLIDVVPQQRTYSRRVGGRQQGSPEVFCVGCVGLCPLAILTLLVSAYSHRKAESDDEAKQRQRSGQDNAEVVTHARFKFPPREKKRTDPRREPQHQESEREYNQWIVG